MKIRYEKSYLKIPYKPGDAIDVANKSIVGVYNKEGKKLTNPVEEMDELKARYKESEEYKEASMRRSADYIYNLKNECTHLNYSKHELNKHGDTWWYMYQRPWLKKILWFWYVLIGK